MTHIWGDIKTRADIAIIVLEVYREKSPLFIIDRSNIDKRSPAAGQMGTFPIINRI